MKPLGGINSCFGSSISCGDDRQIKSKELDQEAAKKIQPKSSISSKDVKIKSEESSSVKILNPKYVCDFNFHKAFAFFGYNVFKIPRGSPCVNLGGTKTIF